MSVDKCKVCRHFQTEVDSRGFTYFCMHPERTTFADHFGGCESFEDQTLDNVFKEMGKAANRGKFQYFKVL